MKRMFPIFLLLAATAVDAQKFDVYTGPNLNQFFQFKNDPGPSIAKYGDALGFTLGAGMNLHIYKRYFIRLNLQVDRCSGRSEAGIFGQGGGFIIDADADKIALVLGVFPFNFRYKEKGEFNLGISASGLLHEKFSGTVRGWSIVQGYTSSENDLHEWYEHYYAPYEVGIQGRVAYSFNLSKSVQIVPQYMYYLGLSKAFREFPETTKSMRHYLSVGVRLSHFRS